MKVDDVGDWPNPNSAIRNFARSALILAGSILAVATALCLLALSTGQLGSGGPWGVAAAAGICLLGGLAAEGAAEWCFQVGSPLAALVAEMALRAAPPLFVCLLLAINGGGREHLPFVVYLLAFYLVTLTLGTCWAVRRVASASSQSHNR